MLQPTRSALSIIVGSLIFGVSLGYFFGTALPPTRKAKSGGEERSASGVATQPLPGGTVGRRHLRAATMDAAPNVAPDLVEDLRALADGRATTAQISSLFGKLSGLDEPKIVDALLMVEGWPGTLRERPIVALLGRLTEISPQSALLYLRRQSGDFAGAFREQAVFSKWGAKDPKAALAAARALPPAFVQAAIGAVIGAVARIDPEAALALALEAGEAARPLAWKQVFQRLAELAPAAALERAVAQQPGLRSSAVAGVFTAWADRDPDAAMTAARGLTDSTLRSSAFDALLSTVAASDPQKARSLLLSLPSAERLLAATSGDVIEVLGAGDPVAAAQAALSLPPGVERTTAITSAGRAWAQQDPAAAMAWLRGLPPQERRTALRAVWPEMARRVPGQISTLLESYPAGRERNEILESLADDPGALSLQAARSLIERHTKGVMGDQLTARLIGAEALRDPTSARAFVDGLPEGEARRLATYQLAYSWAQVDVLGALEWTRRLPADETRQRSMDAIFNNWAGQNPAAAAQYAAAIPATDGRDQAISAAASAWANVDPDAALAWAQTLPERDRGRALVNVIAGWAGQDPAAAAKFLTTLSPDDNRAQMLASVATAWANQDPAAAAQWVEGLDGRGKDRATSAVARRFVQHDPYAASVWIDGLPKGTARDSAVEQLVFNETRYDPDSALAWASSVSDAALRQRLIEIAARSYGRRDAAAAQEALQKLQLTDEERAAALRAIQNPGRGPGGAGGQFRR